MPFQDPSTYNLGGSESSQITTSSDTVTFTAIESSGTAYLYKDFGASYFGDFSIQAVVNITANSGLASFVPISLANTPAVNDDALVTADDGMGLLFSTSGNPVPSFVNHEDETTTGGLASSAKSTDLYITIDRTGTTLTITIRTSSHGGTLVDSDTLTVPTTSYRYLYIGQSRGVGGGTTTATLRDIEVGCVPQNGIGDELAWWCPTLDDDNENTANLHDVTCQGLDGTLDASMTPAPAWVDDTGAGGARALEFDGTDDLVSMGDVLNPGTGDFTWSLWLNASTTLDTSNAGGRVIQKRGTGAVGSVAGFTIGVRRNGTKVRISNTAIDDATNGYAISDSGTQDELGFDIGDTSTWIHLVAIVDRTADELKFYADGVLLNTSDISSVTGSLSNTRDFTLGASDDSETQYFKGLIDDARVWNRQLIASEISHLYDSGTGRGILGAPVSDGGFKAFFASTATRLIGIFQ